MKRRVLLLALWLAAVAIAALAPVGTRWAGADEPDRVGWWNKLNTAPPANPLPLPLPPPPAVPVPPLDPSAPAGSIQVAADPTGEAAVGALHYPVAAGASTALTLTSTKPLVMPPDAVLQLCEVFGPWEPVENGKWEARPQYGGRCFVGVVEGDTVTWDVPGELVVGEFGLNVAVVPIASQVPYQATFAPPDAGSLVVTGSGTSEPDPTPEPFFEPVPVFEEPAPVFDAPLPIFDVPTPPTTIARPSTTLPPRALTPVRPVVSPKPFKDTTRGERIFAVALLGALLAAWWWVGSLPGRGPRLLSAPGASTSGVLNVQSVRGVSRQGGVGRFAKLRTTSPRRL